MNNEKCILCDTYKNLIKDFKYSINLKNEYIKHILNSHNYSGIELIQKMKEIDTQSDYK